MARIGVALIIIGATLAWIIPMGMVLFLTEKIPEILVINFVRVGIGAIIVGIILVINKHVKDRKKEVEEENDYSEY